VLRATEYSLPADVASFVEWVGPTIRFPSVAAVAAHSGALTVADRPVADRPVADRPVADRPVADRRGRRLGPAAAALPVTPARIRELYNVSDADASAASGPARDPRNVQAVVGFLEEYASDADVQRFFDQFEPGMAREDRAWHSIDPDAAGSGMETAMDLEYIMSVGRGVSTEFWYVAGRAPGRPHNEPFLAWLARAMATPDAGMPLVFSVSYCDWEESVPLAYARAVDVQLMKLALRGVTVVVASGDGGVEGAQPLPHYAWPGHDCKEGDEFIATFPAASPWVTAVGATTGLPVNGDEEAGAALSGGGFSEYFARPAWQEKKVDAWLSGAAADGELPPPERYRRSGRGIPDVALQGTDVAIVHGGRTLRSGGTSASTPTLAGLVSLMNARRLERGMPPVGFLNPLLYGLPDDAFRDVTRGRNPGCGSRGFVARRGWDPVTGLGSPDFARMLRHVMEAGRVEAGRGSSPGGGAFAAPDAVPDAAPDAAPDASPSAAPDAAPDASPSAAPSAALQ
jgi:tripeptidyl-peptidase-1